MDDGVMVVILIITSRHVLPPSTTDVLRIQLGKNLLRLTVVTTTVTVLPSEVGLSDVEGVGGTFEGINVDVDHEC
jgi:hypothetical protein